MDIIWCLMHCSCGQLEKTASIYRKKLSKQAVSDISVPTYERLKKYEGEWHTEQMPLFPENILVEVKNRELFLQELADEPPTGFQFLTSEENTMLQALWDNRYCIKMSVGYIKNGITHVTEGPLRGKEGCICRIDRHKRLAKLKLGASQREVYAGLEIITKS